MRGRRLIPVIRFASVWVAIASGTSACMTPAIETASPDREVRQVPLAETEAAPVDAPATSGVDMLETGRARVRDTTERVARGIDGWFGHVPPDGSPRVVSGAIGLRTLWRQDAGWDLAGRFNARVDLPNLRDRAYLLIGRENERDLVRDRPDAFNRQEQLLQERPGDRQFFVGLGLRVRDAIELRTGIRGGYKVYTQARLSHLWQLGERDRIEFRETLFWTIVDGVGSTTVLNYDHTFSRTLALRWLTAGTISQKSDGFGWWSSMGLYKVFGDLRLLSLEALVNGRPSRVNVSEYGLRLRWEQPLYSDWLLGEFVVGHFWPREETFTERGRSWAAGFGVVMRF
jgi:hypothetical protein